MGEEWGKCHKNEKIPWSGMFKIAVGERSSNWGGTSPSSPPPVPTYGRCLHEKFWKSRFVFGMVFELILANEPIPSSKCFIIAPTYWIKKPCLRSAIKEVNDWVLIVVHIERSFYIVTITKVCWKCSKDRNSFTLKRPCYLCKHNLCRRLTITVM